MSDLIGLEQSVTSQLTDCNALKSLQVQNHVYGCFILMEDIAQEVVTITNNVVSGSGFSFDLDENFADIGLRYGFIFDTKLALDTFLPEYKEQWLKHFQLVSSEKQHVDMIEDSLIDIVHKTAKPEHDFFAKALKTGVLPQEILGKILTMLVSGLTELESAKLALAQSEKPVPMEPVEAKPDKKVRFSITRRHNIKPVIKKYLAKTRRTK